MEVKPGRMTVVAPAVLSGYLTSKCEILVFRSSHEKENGDFLISTIWMGVFKNGVNHYPNALQLVWGNHRKWGFVPDQAPNRVGFHFPSLAVQSWGSLQAHAARSDWPCEAAPIFSTGGQFRPRYSSSGFGMRRWSNLLWGQDWKSILCLSEKSRRLATGQENVQKKRTLHTWNPQAMKH